MRTRAEHRSVFATRQPSRLLAHDRDRLAWFSASESFDEAQELVRSACRVACSHAAGDSCDQPIRGIVAPLSGRCADADRVVVLVRSTRTVFERPADDTAARHERPARHAGSDSQQRHDRPLRSLHRQDAAASGNPRRAVPADQWQCLAVLSFRSVFPRQMILGPDADLFILAARRILQELKL